jgi:plasmid maintenance system antidote protein VapI
MHRTPTPPGEILLEEWLKPMKLTQLGLAKKMGVDIQLVNGWRRLPGLTKSLG